MLQVGRGCPYNCAFCSVTAFSGRMYRRKPLGRVLKEIDTLLGIDRDKRLVFADDNLLSIPAYSRELLKILIPYRIRWWCQASLNRLKDDRLLELLRDSGCEVISVGFESTSQDTLDSLDKGVVNKAAEYTQITEKVSSYGISLLGNFILGNDTDDEDVFTRTVEFITDAGIPLATISILTPLPGTALRERLQEEGRILHNDWWKYNFESICFKPKMDLEVLEHGRAWVLQQIYSYDALHQRFTKVWANGGVVKDYLSKKRKCLVFLRMLLSKEIDRTWFGFRGFWEHGTAAWGLQGLGVDFHDYAYKSLIHDSRNK